MTERERRHDDPVAGSGDMGNAGSGNLDALRRAGQGFLNVGDAAINRALGDGRSQA